MDWQLALTVVKDVVTTVAAATAGVVAIIGLKAWKKQLKGKTDYELARRYLRAAYKVRDAIKFVRNPFIPVEEMHIARKEDGLEPAIGSTDNQTMRLVYDRRWKKLNEAVSDLDVELLEAEVSWGKPAVQSEEELDHCRRRLYASLKSYLEGRGDEKVDDIIYDTGKENTFTTQVNAAVRKIEDYLKPHLS